MAPGLIDTLMSYTRPATVQPSRNGNIKNMPRTNTPGAVSAGESTKDKATITSHAQGLEKGGTLQGWITGANSLIRRYLPAVVKRYIPKTLKDSYREFVNQYAANTEETNQKIETAKKLEAEAAKPEATKEIKAKAVAAKKTAAEATRKQMNATVQAATNGNQRIMAKAAVIIESMSDEEAIAAFGRISKTMEEAGRNGNYAAFKAAAKELKNIILKIAAQRNKPSVESQEASHDSLRIYSKVNSQFQASQDAGLKELEKQENTPDGQAAINKLSQDVKDSFEISQSLVESAKSANIVAPQEVLDGLNKNIEADQRLAVGIIEVAVEKGYKLDNFAQLAGIAGVNVNEGTEVGGSAETYATTDFGQVNILGKIHKALNDLVQTIMDQLSANRKENKALDEASAKALLENKRIENDFIKKLQDKKLQSKLHAELIVLSYLIQNPGDKTSAQVKAVVDEVNKIRMHFINPQYPKI